MEVNFFQRRKILKKSNALDLIPVRLLNHEPRDDGNLNILLPRFKKPWLARFMAPLKRKEFIRIKLDQSGSATWMLINGIRPVRTICEELEKENPGKMQPGSETIDRVNKFISILYQQRFITFRQIQKENS
ncbi:MAG: hypothetical protein ABIK52_02090 [Bacteroidota bacterium]